MSDALPVRSLHLHSLNTLLDDLVSARPVGLDGSEAPPSVLRSPEARSLLDWYRKNRPIWSKPVGRDTLRELIDAVGAKPPDLAIASETRTSRKTYKLKRVEIHQFAGVREYGTETPLTIDFDKPLILLEGRNGCGKTSPLNAAVWCLTGKVLRAQRLPADGEEKVALKVDDDVEADKDATVSALVCPVPPKAVLDSQGGKPFPIDTWVAMTFEETEGGREVTLKRRLTREANARNAKADFRRDGFDDLGLDPIAFDIGTTIPGILPHVRIGERSDLGAAIAEPTGFAPLRSMVDHVRRARNGIKKELINKEYKEAVIEVDKRFIEARTELESVAKENTGIVPLEPTTLSPDGSDVDRRLRDAASVIDRRLAEAYTDAQAILGPDFNPADAGQRKKLDEAVGEAIAALKPAAIAPLPSVERLSGLKRLTDEELDGAEALIRGFRAEACELRALAADPGRDARVRLYVRVANWLRETGRTTVPDQCPVCLQPFDARPDPATGRAPRAHVVEALNMGKSYLEKTLENWAAGVSGTLARDLPEALSKAMNVDLPAGPADLLRAALTDELFRGDAFKGVLDSLKARATELAETHLSALPPFVEPPTETSLDGEPSFAALSGMLRRLDRAVAFARWRREAEAPIAIAFHAIVGRAGENEEGGGASRRSLRHLIELLADVVRRAAPASAALRHIAAMRRELDTRDKRLNEIARAEKAVNHLSELSAIDDLVVGQLDVPRRRLDGAVQEWFDRVYVPATTGSAPKLRRSAFDSSGVLDVSVERGGTLVSASTIGNASFLRAYLTAFLFAFWKYVHETRGGLSLLLLDDPQELFDPHNRRRVAETIVDFVGETARAIVATHDNRFALEMCAKARPRETYSHYSVHGRNENRACVVLAPSAELLETKRRAAEERDNHQAAREYAADFRIFVEARLADMLDAPAYVNARTLELSDFLGELNARRSTSEVLAGRAFDALRDAPALQPGAPLRDVLRRAHHRGADEVVWGEVHRLKDDFDRVRRLILDAHDEYRRWLRRDPVPSGGVAPGRLTPMRRPTFGTLRGAVDLPAFSTLDGAAGGAGSAEAFSDTWFSDKTLFALAADTLGFAVPSGSLLLVESESSEVEDHRLVIARIGDRVYARRVARSGGNVALVAENGDPAGRPPTIFVSASDVVLHKVVGAIFSDRRAFARNGDEAYEQPYHPRLGEIASVHRLSDGSGVPLALEGQTVLGGAVVTPATIETHRRRLVAVATADGRAYLKRVGEALAGQPNLRLFESVGGGGDSMVVRMDAADDRLPVFASAREVIGVLHE